MTVKSSITAYHHTVLKLDWQGKTKTGHRPGGPFVGKVKLEICREELLSNVKALQFIHRFNLLLSLSSSIVKGLILLLDSSDFSLDFGLPITVLKLSAFMILVLKLSYFFKFVLLLNF